MSAHSLRVKLKEAESKIALLSTSASEWKEVADDRLSIIKAYAEMCHQTISYLKDVGVIQGINPPVGMSESNWKENGRPTYAIEALGAQIEQISMYVCALSGEVFTTENALDESLAIINDAMLTQPPSDGGSVMKSIQRCADVSSRIAEAKKIGLNALDDYVNYAEPESPMTVPQPKRKNLLTSSSSMSSAL